MCLAEKRSPGLSGNCEEKEMKGVLVVLWDPSVCCKLKTDLIRFSFSYPQRSVWDPR